VLSSGEPKGFLVMSESDFATTISRSCRQTVSAWIAAAACLCLAALASTSAAAEAKPKWNVLLLTVDAMRPASMSVYGYDRDTTPYLKQFAKEALVFENAFATSSWTSPGMVSMLTGYYPPTHGQNGRHSFYDAEMTAALRILAEAGYDIAGHTVKGPTYANLGMTRVVRRKGGAERYLEGRIDNDTPFFLWAHLKEVHLPYAPSEPNAARWGGNAHDSAAVRAARDFVVVFRPDNVDVSFKHPGKVVFDDDDKRTVRALYDGGVADVDARIKNILERMRETGMLDRTIVIISADHGEELFEHGWVGHASTSYDGKLYDELIRIPMLLRLPNGAKTGRFDALVQGVDVMPTIFDVLGLDPARLEPAMQGHSLLEIADGRRSTLRDYVFTETTRKGWTTPRDEMPARVISVRSKTRKLIYFPYGTGYRTEGYDLVADPGEQTDIYPARAAEFADLQRALGDWSARNRQAAADLVQPGARRQIANLTDAAEQGDMREAVKRWQAIDTMHTTWGMEVAPFYADEAHAASWTEIRRAAAGMLGKAMDCEAQGGQLTIAQGGQRDDVGAWSCRK
jgi:arylsulfatase A-like enzyme